MSDERDRPAAEDDAAPEVLRSGVVYDGGLLRVRVDEIRLPTGRETRRQVVEHPGAVAVLAVTEDDHLLLVRQWRHAAGRALLEIPAGTREPDEPPAETARRELTEETGYAPATLTELTTFFACPGYSNERIVLFRADGCRPVAASAEVEEGVRVVRVRLADLPALLSDPKQPVDDGKTLAALLWLWLPSGMPGAGQTHPSTA